MLRKLTDCVTILPFDFRHVMEFHGLPNDGRQVPQSDQAKVVSQQTDGPRTKLGYDTFVTCLFAFLFDFEICLFFFLSQILSSIIPTDIENTSIVSKSVHSFCFASSHIRSKKDSLPSCDWYDISLPLSLYYLHKGHFVFYLGFSIS